MTEFPYKRIVSYGCSLTAGTELMDHAALDMTEEEYIQYLNNNKLDSIPKIYSHLIDNFPEKMIKMEEMNAQASWPNFICNHYNVPHLNRGFPGASITHTTFKILSDIHSNATNDSDLLLVGITSPNRWFQFLPDGGDVCGIFSHPWHHKLNRDYAESVEKHWANVYNIVYSYFKEIAFLSDLSDTLNGRIKLCYAFGTPSYFREQFSEELTDEKFKDFFEFCFGLVPNHNIIDEHNSICELAMQFFGESQHVFGHPKVRFHEKFANILIENLSTIYKIK